MDRLSVKPQKSAPGFNFNHHGSGQGALTKGGLSFGELPGFLHFGTSKGAVGLHHSMASVEGEFQRSSLASDVAVAGSLKLEEGFCRIEQPLEGAGWGMVLRILESFQID